MYCLFFLDRVGKGRILNRGMVYEVGSNCVVAVECLNEIFGGVGSGYCACEDFFVQGGSV